MIKMCKEKNDGELQILPISLSRLTQCKQKIASSHIYIHIHIISTRKVSTSLVYTENSEKVIVIQNRGRDAKSHFLLSRERRVNCNLVLAVYLHSPKLP
mmetsp:Transcript_7915/g.16451  ORF Transcript_7915/g.16451 Transcript_7915/m.16451 type:complete len:99 (-) Transcript_7915:1913-2209(-)